jgi:hypothetical protein
MRFVSDLYPALEAMSLPPVRKPAKAFAFDGEYSAVPARENGLVSFFADEAPATRSTEWSSTPVPEEDLREGMDDFRKAEDSAEDLSDLIASMPHNVAKRQPDDANNP